MNSLRLLGEKVAGANPHQGVPCAATRERREHARRTSDERRAVAALYPRERHLVVVPASYESDGPCNRPAA